jgi:hypothetical protein
MTETTIYDSSGAIRYPATATHPDADKERIRDLFFNSVYVRVADGTVDLNFYASTGTPEQFVGTVETGLSESSVQTAHSELSSVVETDLDWSMADRDASEGHRLFSSLPEISPREVSRYSIDSLRAATAGENQTIDLGAPDIDRAISVFHWLLQHTEQRWSIAITGDGRSAVVDDIDIVIVPGVTDDSVVGINGSDADIQRRFIKSKTDATIDALRGVVPQQVQPGRVTPMVRGNLEWLLNQIGGDEYLAETPAETDSRTMGQVKVGGPMLAIVGFAVAFVLAGGIDTLSSWWTTTVLGGDPVQLFTLTRMASLLGGSPPTVSPRVLVGLSIVVLLVWVGIVVLFEKARLSASGDSDDGNPYVKDASREFGTEMNGIFNDINQVSWAAPTDLLDGLTTRPNAIPGDIRIRSRSGERRERLLRVGGISALAALVAGIFGYGTGLYLSVLLGAWKSIAEGLLIGGSLTVVAGVIWVVLNELLVDP